MKPRPPLSCAVLLLGTLAVLSAQPRVPPTPSALRCEHLSNPLGIDTSQPGLSWNLDTDPAPTPASRGIAQSSYHILVATSPERLAQNQGDLWDSGSVPSSESSLIPYAGTPLPSRQRAHWKVRITDTSGAESPWSPPASWTMGLLRPEHWHARWITHHPAPKHSLPAFRTAFRIEKPLRRAELALCGLGFHEAHLNGSPISTSVLEPGWTNYRKTCLYRVHDLTRQLVPGENVLGILLGNGMYHVTGGRYTKFTGSFGPPKVIAQLDLEFADGSTTRIVTDKSWSVAPSPITFSCIFGGEDYDARREIPRWNQPGFDASAWQPAQECEGPGGRLTTRSAPPVHVLTTFQPLRYTQPRPGTWVYDLGQNFSGWPKLTVQGDSGSTVRMITGELLDEHGLVSQASSGSPVWFAYTAKGDGLETWRPRFSYSGFRYVQMDGVRPSDAPSSPGPSPRIHRLEGEFLGPDTPTDGAFACSNPEVNRVHALILAAIRSNFKSVLTDCPHREKLGWLECSHLLAGCFLYNDQGARFYAKIAQDMADSQLDDGLVPSIAPEYVVFSGGFRDSPEWGSARILSPWRAYRMYGDHRLLAEHYDGMKRYVAYLAGKAKDHVLSHGLGDWYDIGPRGPGESQLTSRGLTATGVYYQDIDTLRHIAQILGKPQDAHAFARQADAIAKAFEAAFFNPDQNLYDRNSQTANAMPLALGMVEPARRPAVLENLVRNIREGGHRVTAGDVGFYYVVQALLNGGRSDVLYAMLCQTNGPGYLHQLAKNATSLTEAWDTNPGSSQNHCMLGHIEEWFYTGLLGIRPESPGFQRFLLRPQPVGDLTWARGHYDSTYGRIVSDWKREGTTFTWTVRIPANTTATVFVPSRHPESITESGQPATAAPGLKHLRSEGDTTVFHAGSGLYHFQSTF